MAAENNRNTRLQKLSGSDFEIVDGQSDIRGWDVIDDSGKRLGEVDELIFDYQSRKVRYLVLDLEDNDYDLEDRDVLVPIGIAELHKEDDDVLLPGVTAEQLRSLPEYDEDRFDQESETSIRNVFGGLGATTAVAGGSNDDHDFYNHDHFNEENLYRNRRDKTDTSIPVVQENLEVGKKEVETGGIRLRSRINETPVEENITLREEHVHVERAEVNRPVSQSDLDSLGQEEIEIRERQEVPVVSKEARVVEEVKLSKEVTEHNESIRDTVRNTEVDIENIDRGTTNRSNSDIDDLDDDDFRTKDDRNS